MNPVQSPRKTKAVCLFSGGLDSTTALYAALQKGYEVQTLTIHYGQTHEKEVECARRIASSLGLENHVIRFSLPWGGSALLDREIPIPLGRQESEMAEEIPVTYVPARNSVFLSFAASYAEACGAGVIFLGANALDYSGYPDCRPEYFVAFSEAIRRGTKAGAEGRIIRIEAPLLRLSKKEIVELGVSLGVPFEKTWSCYRGKEIPCGGCDSCLLRAKGFREAGIRDPLRTVCFPEKYELAKS
jgi:7-cyano-7-deazaguanine synthase